MTKAEFIRKYGEERYEQHKANTKRNFAKYYYENLDKEKARNKKYRAEHRKEHREYCRTKSTTYRICCRDRQRLKKMGMLKDGQVVHHLKYHADNNDKSWIDDILILSHEEHNLWHIQHPEFIALENVI